MQQNYIAPFFVLGVLLASDVRALESIQVMVAKTPGVTNADALGTLLELNELMNKSDLSGRLFLNANGGLPIAVYDTNCTDTDVEELINCIQDDLGDTRDDLEADIVLVTVAALNGASCGGVLPAVINRPSISPGNRRFGYAVVTRSCALSAPTASHEVLHLLSIEHKRSDPTSLISVPVRNNHAATAHQYATAGASPYDCTGTFTGCTIWENIMSEAGNYFSPGSAYPAGNSLHSNAKDVVKNLSWNAVAAYRPVPQLAQNCNIRFELGHCDGSTAVGTITATLPGYSVTFADYDVQINGGSWIDIFEGILTCPVLNVGRGGSMIGRAILETPSGTSQCTVNIPTSRCGGGGRRAF